MQKHAPQRKHFVIKHHWFKENIDKIKVKIIGIRTQSQSLYTGFTRKRIQNQETIFTWMVIWDQEAE